MKIRPCLFPSTKPNLQFVLSSNSSKSKFTFRIDIASNGERIAISAQGALYPIESTVTSYCYVNRGGRCTDFEEVDSQEIRRHVSTVTLCLFNRSTYTDLDSSDADSDVLADYVLALVRSEDSDVQVKQNCLENLEDFLRARLYTLNAYNE